MSASDVAQEDEPNRRDFIHLLAIGGAALGGAAAVWPFVDQLNPDASTKALASIEVDLGSIEVGQAIRVMWRGKPVFIRRRTPEEIERAVADDGAGLPDPQADIDRVKDQDGVARPEWLILVGVCTHLGCIPLGTDQGDNTGDYNGWYCPCHGSHYDISGRIRKGPAPENLPVPQYAFISDTRVKIG